MVASVRSAHFVGICGTAMASVAAALKDRGIRVSGSDEAVYPPMSEFLAERGIEVRRGFSGNNLDDRPDLTVIGNAIPRGNPEAEAVLSRRLAYCSLPELVREFFIGKRRSIVVTGTHGKTTTASLLAWVLESAGLDPGYLIGAIPNNFEQGARITEGEWFVAEGDEYDCAFFDKRSKFIHYQPEVAVINNVEFDHADIFRDLRAVQTSFNHLVRLVPANGLLLANGDDRNVRPLLEVDFCPVKTFGLAAHNTFQARGIAQGPEGISFRVGEAEFRVGLLGEFNVRNALAVVACGRYCGLSDGEIQSGFDTFKGVKRRLEIRGEAGGVTVIDDFGHHPTAIGETLAALRGRYPGSRLWAIFEPRSNTTRRRVFERELTSALARADVAVIARVARLELLPEEQRLDPDRLVNNLRELVSEAVYLPDVGSIVDRVARGAKRGDVVCVFSNGGFGGIHERLLDRLGG